MIFDNCETVNIEFKKVFITPDMAKYILDNNNIGNRRLSASYKKYAADMKNGTWEQLSVASIILYDGANDILKDGQHRLAAIVESGIGQWFYVYLKPDVKVIDRGRKRTVDDIMRLRGCEEDVADSFVTAIAKTYFDLFADNHLCSDSQIIDFCVKHADELKKARRLTVGGRGTITKHASVGFATFCALYSGVDYNLLENFFKVVNTGFANGDKDSSAVVLRKMLEESKGHANTKQRRLDRALFVDDAIRDYVNGVTRKLRYKKCNGKYIKAFCNDETQSNTSGTE